MITAAPAAEAGAAMTVNERIAVLARARTRGFESIEKSSSTERVNHASFLVTRPVEERFKNVARVVESPTGALRWIRAARTNAMASRSARWPLGG
jgi:hypothetical protein